MTANETKTAAIAALNFSIELAKAIRLAGPTGINSGALYAAAATKGYTHDYYARAINFLKDQGLIKEASHSRNILIATI
jgi:hypothetical protein